MNRRSYYPSNQQLISQTTSTAVDASRPVTPKSSMAVDSPGGAAVPEGYGETERYAHGAPTLAEKDGYGR
jgi:hypothetical protein